jgi:hypothetical protein
MRREHRTTTRRHGWRPYAAAGLLGAGACLLEPSAAAWQPPPRPLPVPLRLDESPALPLLAPFRDASGPSGSFLRRYLEGPYGRWRVRPWHTLAWTFDAPSVPEATTPLPPDEVGLALDSTTSGGWPSVLSERHWFQPAPIDLTRSTLASPPEGLSISTELVPPWLQRLDEQWAVALLSSSGCGRGGECSTEASFPAEAFRQLWDALSPQAWPIPSWKCKARPVTMMRYGRETDSFELVRCDGSIAPGALDRLSLIARPTGVDRPGELLPDEPDWSADHGEWLRGVRLMHPRLLWVLQAVAHAFPHRAIYVVSGYRPAPSPPPPGTRASYHWEGRALDISVLGASNDEVFKVCHSLDDVGCGFYPNKSFVHLDVRRYGDGRVFWIDASHPGERTKYVDSWPGVVERGAMAWAPPPAGE